jgi:hypothetical protein
MREKQSHNVKHAGGSTAQTSVARPVGDQDAPGLDPIVEEKYWRENFASRPYVIVGAVFEEYQPAYKYGWESFRRHPGRTFDQVEADLRRFWDNVKGRSQLGWNHAKHAVRDAWDRLAHHE